MVIYVMLKQVQRFYSQRLLGWWKCVCWNDRTAPLRRVPSWAAQTPQSESKAQCSSSWPICSQSVPAVNAFIPLWLCDTHSMVKFQLSSLPCLKIWVYTATYCWNEKNTVPVTSSCFGYNLYCSAPALQQVQQRWSACHIRSGWTRSPACSVLETIQACLDEIERAWNISARKPHLG